MSNRRKGSVTATKVQAWVEATPELVAKLFAELTDDDQAQMLCLAAAEMKAWPDDGGRWQMTRVGKHLAECVCSTEDGRDLVRTIYETMTDAIATKRSLDGRITAGSCEHCPAGYFGVLHHVACSRDR